MLRLQKFVLITTIMATIALSGVSSAEAQFLGRRGPFDTCNTPKPVLAPLQSAAIDPCCAPPACGCAETTLVTRQQVTYRNVNETRYRQETVARMVPVTVYKQEQYTRMVPYTVTRQVPEVRTVYQPQTTFRTQSAYGYRPVTTAYAPVMTQPAFPVQAFASIAPQTASKLPPNAEVMDLRQLNANSPSYDDVSAATVGSAAQRPIGRSAASVFRTFR
ncbi:MAG: hypothetical protein P8M30_18160 [Planctomycetaceae bacterium]|nr:hypothetical protein [Planctomycetaceae bacterium]MDG2391235.1 hypothetical protein [Planctomycetaceae bacterium]